MKLRNKVSIIVLTLWCIVLVAAYASSQFILSKSYFQLEQTQANINMLRAKEAIDQSVTSLNTVLSTWAIWDDAYQFAIDHNKSFIDSNLIVGTFAAIDIDGIFIYDTNGKSVYAQAIDSKRTHLKQPPSDWFTTLDSLSRQLLPDGSIHGFANTDNGIIMIVGQPIMASNNKGPSHGMMFMVKYLSKDVISKIRKLIKLDLTLYPLADISNNSNLMNAYLYTQENREPYLERTSDTSMSGYSLLYDINKKPIALIKTAMPRLIYQFGVETVSYYNGIFVIYATLLMLFLWYLLQSLLVRRLESLKQQISNIDENNHYFKKLINGVSDEVTTVASLYHHATHDPLTGLANRTLLEQAFIYNQSKVIKSKNKIAIIFIDLDYFKRINDSLGHEVGDALLIEVARNLNTCLRENDLAARLGGDEFSVMISDVTLEKINIIAERLFKTFSKPIHVNDHELHISTCMGIGIYPDHGNDFATILNKADIALYHAKANDRNCYFYYSDDLNKQILEAHRKEAELQHALDNKELCLFFQPIFDVMTKRIISYEALIRWRHPERGLLNAAEIIPLAEKSGLIVPIGKWVLTTACRQAKTWQDQGYANIPIAVNISILQTKNTSIYKLVTDALKETGLEPEFLELELTETSYVEITETILNDMRLLKELGVKLAVDDFGVGYSGLGYLRSLPISKLKIDSSFVKDALSDPDDNAITLAIIAIAHQLDLQVIAEGVETIAHFEFLKINQVDAVQGNYLCKPLDAEAFIKYVMDKPNTSIQES
jgi:diguanylate cyclase (GGDEF)-like protein